MMDAVIAVLFVSMLIAAFYFAKLYWWVWFWTAVTLLLAGFELASKVKTGRTLSQQFWAYSVVHKEEAWILTAVVLVMGIALPLHLIWKVIK